MLCLAQGEWFIKDGAALKRHFGFHDPMKSWEQASWAFHLLFQRPVTAYRKKDNEITIQSGKIVITCPYVFSISNPYLIVFTETFETQKPKSGGGFEKVIETRIALTLERKRK